MNNYNTKHNAIFYGRRKGRKLSKSRQLAIINGKRFILKEDDLTNIIYSKKNIILEIGFGDGKNLINSAKVNPNLFYIGADPFVNTTAQCINKLLFHNLKNVLIWPDDVRKILKLFPCSSISEIKITFFKLSVF